MSKNREIKNPLALEELSRSCPAWNASIKERNRPESRTVAIEIVKMVRFGGDEPEKLADQLAEEFQGERWRRLISRLQEWDEIPRG